MNEGLGDGIGVVGKSDGAGVGTTDGIGLGAGDGISEGLGEGMGVVGNAVGDAVGKGVGSHVVHANIKLEAVPDGSPNWKTSHSVDIKGGVLLHSAPLSAAATALLSPAISQVSP